MNEMLHTPEGVRDLYGLDCARKQVLKKSMMRVFHRYGYRDIETPMFEYVKVFSDERGSVRTKDMFQFFDKQGNTLALRPDITPQIGRTVAKYFGDQEDIIRLCYAGDTFQNSSRFQGRLKEITQTGIELVGEQSAFADAEVIACMADSFLEAGLSEFIVEVGHAGIIRGLVEKLSLSEEEREEVYHLLTEKNTFGLEEMLTALSVPEDHIKDLLLVGRCFGGIKEIRQVAKELTDENLKEQIAYLEKVFEILGWYGLSSYVSFDLGLVSPYRYYTGIILRGYTYGTGELIATGGRYDSLLGQFGKSLPAVGFAVQLDELLTALQRQQIAIPVDNTCESLVVKEGEEQKAIKEAVARRKAGGRIALVRGKGEGDV